MDSSLLFVFLLLLLFLLSKSVSAHLGLLIIRFAKNKKALIYTEAIVFFPGTVIHEFAHAAVAQGLGVYVGDIELMPKIEGKNIKLGSVKVGVCDPIRSFLIGAAPLLAGITLIILTMSLYSKLQLSGFWLNLLLFYVLFQIGNTMFSSKRDMEGAVSLSVALALVLGVLYLLGFNQVFETLKTIPKTLEPFFKMANPTLSKIVFIDVGVIIAAKLLESWNSK